MQISPDDLTTAMWVYDIEKHRICWANQAAINLWEAHSAKDLYNRDFSVTTSDALQESLDEYKQVFIHGHKLSVNWYFSPHGIDKQAFCQLSGLALDDGRMGMLVEAIPATLLNSNDQQNAITLLSTYFFDGQFVSANPPFFQDFSQSIKELSEIIGHPKTLATIYRDLQKHRRFEGDVLMHTTSGERWYHLIALKTDGKQKRDKILLQQYDIHQRKINELSLEQEVLSDPLTGLMNRRGLIKKLQELEENEHSFIIFYIDLDGFKLVNDSFGHLVGDQLLKTVSQRLLEPVLEDSFACRFGGDEFILMVKDTGVASTLKHALAEQLIESISAPYYDNDNHPLTLSASIGVAHYPTDTQSITDIIVYADAAMYYAKKNGKRRWIDYQKGMEEQIRRQSTVAQQLYLAESNDELCAYYQPIWDTKLDRIISFEALLRWHSKILGEISAEETIRVAEDIGIISEIENWVIRQALGDLVILRETVAADASMSVNISALHLRDEILPDFLSNTLREYQLEPQHLTVELTENALIDDITEDNNIANRLKEKGINISIDDFGTGYSSLAYLNHIPATTVKIDRSFVARLEDNRKTLHYIHKLIKAHDMLPLIEGVETLEQKQQLEALGINLHQGFALGRPQPLSHYISPDLVSP